MRETLTKNEKEKRQTTVRIESDLLKEMKFSALTLDETLEQWYAQACRERLDRLASEGK